MSVVSSVPLYQGFAIVTWLIATVVHGQSCYSNVVSLRTAIIDRTDFTSVVTYKICANTTFDLTMLAADDFYLFLRRKMKLMCGDNGASSDRCILTGGIEQLTGADALLNEEVSEVQVSGITFANPYTIESDLSIGTTIYFARGPITFTDCIFRNVNNAIGLYVAGPLGSSTGTSDRTTIVIDKCVFENSVCNITSSQGLRGLGFDGLVYGLVTVLGSVSITIQETVFRNNKIQKCNVSLSDSKPPLSVGLIGVGAGAKLTMSNNCFIDNVLGASNSPIYVAEESGVGTWNGIFTNGDDIVSHGDTATDHICSLAFVNATNQCISPDSKDCFINDGMCGSFFAWLLAVLVQIVTFGFVNICN